MGKYKTINHWNFRVVTKLYNSLLHKEKAERLFSIVEVYYNRKGNPDSYIDSKRILDGLESVKGLKWTNKKIKKAFKKPILDLDNFPNEWVKPHKINLKVHTKIVNVENPRITISDEYR